MSGRVVRLGLGALVILAVLAIAGTVIWVINAHVVNHWLAVHTGVASEAGPYYAFWSGFGSDLAEFGIIGAIATALYQVVKKYNCHQPGCWRVGNHPAADGQFFLCYHHHPDYRGQKPTQELIARLHADHLARQKALQDQLREIHHHLATDRTHPGDTTQEQSSRKSVPPVS
jgi:hypothetical protein